MREINEYEKCFYCKNFKGDRCIFGRDIILCETWAPDKPKIIRYAEALEIPVTDLVTLIKL